MGDPLVGINCPLSFVPRRWQVCGCSEVLNISIEDPDSLDWHSRCMPVKVLACCRFRSQPICFRYMAPLPRMFPTSGRLGLLSLLSNPTSRWMHLLRCKLAGQLQVKATATDLNLVVRILTNRVNRLFVSLAYKSIDGRRHWCHGISRRHHVETMKRFLRMFFVRFSSCPPARH